MVVLLPGIGGCPCPRQPRLLLSLILRDYSPRCRREAGHTATAGTVAAAGATPDHRIRSHRRGSCAHVGAPAGGATTREYGAYTHAPSRHRRTRGHVRGSPARGILPPHATRASLLRMRHHVGRCMRLHMSPLRRAGTRAWSKFGWNGPGSRRPHAATRGSRVGCRDLSAGSGSAKAPSPAGPGSTVPRAKKTAGFAGSGRVRRIM